MASMYTMALVQRRDITSLRDLKKKDVPWLKTLQKRIVEGICHTYPEIEEDQIKLYIHCNSSPSLSLSWLWRVFAAREPPPSGQPTY